MLVLTRKSDESIMIGDSIEVTVVEIKGRQVRVGINAPGFVPVYRKEVYLAIKQENLNAVHSATSEDALKLASAFEKR